MQEHWLNKERLTNYPRIFLALYLIAGIIWILLSHKGLDPRHKALGYDFITYWAASHLALKGVPASAYDLVSIVREEWAIVPGIHSVNPWLYPPTFYLLILPLALMPYFLSYFVFLSSTFAAYFVVVRKIFAGPGSLMLLLAFPGIFINAVQGQNGFLTAALMGGALLLLPRRPLCAGILFGLLTIKPHLGLLIPLALLCGRHWRALFYAAFSAGIFLAIGVAVLGVDTLNAFIVGMGRFSGWAINDPELLAKITSFFSFSYLLGAPLWGAYALFGIIALGVATAVCWIWLRCPEQDLRMAALVCGSLLTSPYLLDYDLAWLALAIAWFGRYGVRHGWLRGEREMLAAVWLLPMFVGAVHVVTHMQLVPFLLLGFFLMILRRSIVAAEVLAPGAALLVKNMQRTATLTDRFL
jgi:alpha-1,2-mannosyltransferase